MIYMAKKQIAVLFGGASADHAASLHTAYSVLKAMPQKIKPLPIGITRAGRWLFYPGSIENIKDGSWERDSDCCSCVISPDALSRGVIKIISDNEHAVHRIDAVFPLLYGKYGEDGRIQGLCKCAGLPVIGNDLAAAALCHNRQQTYAMLDSVGIKTPDHVTLYRSEMNDMDAVIKKITDKLSFPIYTVPTSCSTAVGVCRAENKKQLEEAVKISFSHHPVIIAESETESRSLRCAVFGKSADCAAVGEIITESTDLCNRIYATHTSRFEVPANISEKTRKQALEVSRQVFSTLCCKGFATVDLQLLNSGEICVSRVHALPGLDKESVFSMLATSETQSYEEMLEKIISSVIDID